MRGIKQMSNELLERHYTIIVQGHLDQRWAEWFPGMEILLLPEGLTRFTGMVEDQAALHGMLSRIGDLRLPLLLVMRGNFDLDS
jgi:hypothetical protein